MNTAQPPTAPLRSPETVMRLARMGAFHQTRLSFMRALLRRLKQDGWRFERAAWDVDNKGVGVAEYRALGPDRTYTLVCFAHDLPAEKRSDRVIADQWDATFALYDGIPDRQDIVRLADNVPRQEAGQCRDSELVLSRANRSVRLFNHVVERLASGQQPDSEQLNEVGYLMRTTAVYGNGKFGLSDRERIAGRTEFSASFRVELLAVWLIRWFTLDIVEHMARSRDPAHAVALDRDLARQLGVGNATGLGMAPFLIAHPALIHRWMLARETALARVRALPACDHGEAAVFRQLITRARQGLDHWNVADARQAGRVTRLREDMDAVIRHLETGVLDEDRPWDRITEWASRELGLEAQELLVSLVIEPHGSLVDDLADSMLADESRQFAIDGSMRCETLSGRIERHYGWALGEDYSQPSNCARFWYVSEEKLEPRLGERFEEPGAELEQPLAFARDVAALHDELAGFEEKASVAEFLLRHPEHRHAVRRIGITAALEYAEIRDNLVAAEMLPIDLLRCKLSFFGANRFDPKSDRWVRITMYQFAPFPDELADAEPDDWMYPALHDAA